VISGKITGNENEAIEYALVTLKEISDSSVVVYATTDENGSYQLKTAKNSKFFVQVSYLGYSSQTRPIDLSVDKNIPDFNFTLNPDVIALQEVMVKGRKTGIFFDKDTVHYDLKSFKDGSEVVLGDLLNKLPGIEVDEKGSIKAHGKQVDKLLLNGQDFFQGNTQMATKNLSANIAESVEVISNYSEYSLLSGFQSHDQTVINVGVDKNKLGNVSGNISAGGGLDNKYDVRGDLMQIKPKWMTSIIGSANNNGSEIFSIEDYIRLQGGVSEFTGSQEQQSTIALSEEEQKLLFSRDNVYDRNSGLAGINFPYQPKNSLKINSYLLYNETKEVSEEWNRYTYLFPDQKQYTTSNNLNSSNKNKLFSGLVKMNYQPTPLWNIVYKGMFSNTGMTESADESNSLMNKQVQATGFTDANRFGTRQNIAIMKSLNKHLFVADASFSYDNKPFSYEMQSDSLLLPLPLTMFNNYYYGRQDKKQRNIMANIGFSFFFKITDSYFLRTKLSSSITKQEYNSEIYQTNPGEEAILLPDNNLRNDFSMQMNDYSINLNLTKNKGLFRFNLGASAHVYDFNETGISELRNKKVAKLNPEMQLSLHFNDKHSLNLSGYESDQLLPAEAFLSGVVFDDYQNYSHNSHINKWYDTKYNLNLSYRIFDMYYNTMLILTGGYNRNSNPATINYYSDGLLTERYPVLSVPAETMYARLYLSKGLGVIPWTLKLTGGYNENYFYNQSANQDNMIKVRSTNDVFQIVTNYRNVFNVECKAGLEVFDNSSSLSAIKKQTIQRYSGKLKLNFNKRFWANIELEHVINQLPNANLYQWYLNTSISYKLTDKTEINLSGLNLLHLKNQEWTSVSYNGIYIAESDFRQIPGNLLLKLIYKI